MKILVTGGSGFIGTNYIQYLLLEGKSEFINLDCKPPREKVHDQFWRECDILDSPRLEKIIKDFKPSHVVHLAAKTGMDLKDMSDFAANTQGVSHLLQICNETPSVKRVLLTSSLLVCQMGHIPRSDTEYKPTTLYGQSKVEGEKIVRRAQNLAFAWTIIRPISVWGPWQVEPYINLFKSVAHNWYFHIGAGHYKRSMGYVENMVYQIHQLLLAPLEKVDRKTFYLGDPDPIDLFDFANEIQNVLGTKKIKNMPLWLVQGGAMAGDILKTLGLKNFPLTSFRLNNIRTEYIFNLSPIVAVAGVCPYDMKLGVRRTVEWMQKAS